MHPVFRLTDLFPTFYYSAAGDFYFICPVICYEAFDCSFCISPLILSLFLLEFSTVVSSNLLNRLTKVALRDHRAGRC